MTFNSVDFIVFYSLTLILYYSIPMRFRWMLLLACGYFFYFKGGPIVIMLLITVPDFFIAKYISKKNPRGKSVFAAAVALNVIILAFFKFAAARGGFDFALPFLNAPAGNAFGAAIPLGLSFIILRKISYLCDIRQDLIAPETNIAKYSLYLSYFPSVSSGPIDRYSNFKKEIDKRPAVNYDEIIGGFRLILLGLFKKIFIAERLAMFVNEAYSAAPDERGVTMLLAVYFFSFQIYADFSGYTDIAVGVSRTFGLTLPRNFDRPYFSRSIPEFWKKWHITLSSWLRDYLFMPLAGAFVSRKYLYITEKYRELSAYISAVFITWFLAGAWHGNELSMIIWGLLQAVYLAFCRLTKSRRKQFSKTAGRFFPRGVLNLIKIVFTFHLVSFTWIFFRSESLSKAVSVFKCLFGNLFSGQGKVFLFMSGYDVLLSFAGIIFLVLFDYYDLNDDSNFFRKPAWFRWTFYYLLLFLTLFMGIYRNSGFMYVKF